LIQFLIGFWLGLVVGVLISIAVLYLLAKRPSLLLRLFLRAGVAKIPPEAMQLLTALSMLEKPREEVR